MQMRHLDCKNVVKCSICGTLIQAGSERLLGHSYVGHLNRVHRKIQDIDFYFEDQRLKILNEAEIEEANQEIDKKLRFVCDLCGHRFGRYRYMISHQKKMHNISKPSLVFTLDNVPEW